jgi:hypothetical protein
MIIVNNDLIKKKLCTTLASDNIHVRNTHCNIQDMFRVSESHNYNIHSQILILQILLEVFQQNMYGLKYKMN